MTSEITWNLLCSAIQRVTPTRTCGTQLLRKLLTAASHLLTSSITTYEASFPRPPPHSLSVPSLLPPFSLSLCVCLFVCLTSRLFHFTYLVSSWCREHTAIISMGLRAPMPLRAMSLWKVFILMGSPSLGCCERVCELVPTLLCG